MTFLHILYAILSIHCLDTLDLGAGVEQPFDYLIVQNRQAVQSMLGRLMDWTVKDIMATVCSSFAPHSQTAEGAIPHLFSQQKKKHPTQVRSSYAGSRMFLGGWIPVSGIKVRRSVMFSNHSAFHLWSVQYTAHTCCCPIEWWVVVRKVQMGASI